MKPTRPKDQILDMSLFLHTYDSRKTELAGDWNTLTELLCSHITFLIYLRTDLFKHAIDTYEKDTVTRFELIKTVEEITER